MTNHSEWQEDQNLAHKNEQERIAKITAEREEILNGYTWIKVPRYYEEDPSNPMVDWKAAYKSLLEHHTKETTFLINKVRELIQR